MSDNNPRWASGVIRRAKLWARAIFMFPTHRVVRLAPGMFMQVERGCSDAQVAATIAAYLRNAKEKR